MEAHSMATMADVARKAGVSVSTVSHVINETRPVAEATRHAVLDAIRQMNYTPNSVARSLAMATTRSIGLAISAISNPYFTDLVHAIETELDLKGFTLLVTDPHEQPERELQRVRELHARRVDGIIVAPGVSARRFSLKYLADHAIPTVLVDRLASDRFDQVGGENENATSYLVGHLAARGHRRIAMISGLVGLTTSDERVRGYRRGLERADLPLERGLLVSGASEEENAREAVHRLFSLPQPPTAIVVANNRMTIGAMRGLRELHREVPRDVALVAFDDFEWADLFHPRLTVMAQDVAAIGAHAVRLLLARIDDPARPPTTVRLAPEFVHRDSCGCPTE
jgi:LacI family transcriptional regulator